MPLGATSWTLDQEVFEYEHALTALQGTAASHAGNLTIGSWLRRRFDPHNFVLGPAVRTREKRCVLHKCELATIVMEENRLIKGSALSI